MALSNKTIILFLMLAYVLAGLVYAQPAIVGNIIIPGNTTAFVEPWCTALNGSGTMPGCPIYYTHDASVNVIDAVPIKEIIWTFNGISTIEYIGTANDIKSGIFEVLAPRNTNPWYAGVVDENVTVTVIDAYNLSAHVTMVIEYMHYGVDPGGPAEINSSAFVNRTATQSIEIVGTGNSRTVFVIAVILIIVVLVGLKVYFQQKAKI